MSRLNKEQRATLLDQAVHSVYADMVDDGYRWDIANQFVRQYTPIDQARLVSSDETRWPELFDFDPATGEPWPDDQAQEDE